MKLDVKTTLNKMKAGNTQLVDVRTPSEFESVNIKGAVNIPLDLLADKTNSIPLEGETILICGSGMRAQKAFSLLSTKGFESLSILEGGMQSWETANAPCEYGKQSIPIERQVRITAGALVVVGAGLGILVNSGFLAIPIFVGCGLAFAGITDSCAMGMLIGRMPWNRA